MVLAWESARVAVSWRRLLAAFVQPGAGLRVLRTQLFDQVFLPEGERDGRQ